MHSTTSKTMTMDRIRQRLSDLMGQLCCRSERNFNHSPEERKNKNKSDSVMRFFMAGMGSAGKSTIIRQLQLLSHKNSNYKFCNDDWTEIKTTDIDKEVWQLAIRKNILDCFDIFVKQIRKRDEKYVEEENKDFAQLIEDICDQENAIGDIVFDDEFKENLLRLFEDEAIKKMLKLRNKIDLPHKKLFDGAQYFLTEEKITEVFEVSYEPSDIDKVHSRSPTVNMHNYKFVLNETKIEVHDVGGQKSELLKITDYLHKWSVDSKENDKNFILLVVSMSDYNVPHAQYPQHTLLDESMEYMKLLLNNAIAEKCGLLIFFNKKDRFKEKLSDEHCRHDIDYLKEYLSSSQYREYKNTGKFEPKIMYNAITAKFIENFKVKYPNKSCYCRHTCAVDSKMMESIFATIRNEILNEQFYEVFP